jgi:lipoprotein-releasing system permease protein
LVVAINIFNSMRRIVYERRFEISILSALGGKISSIKNIFIMRGFLTGVRGALPGLVLGMFFCVNIRTVFAVLSAAVYFFQFAFALFFQPALAGSLAENPMFSVYGNIPAKMNAGEVAFITLFGILSAVLSSWAASREVLATAISEVLHDE